MVERCVSGCKMISVVLFLFISDQHLSSAIFEIQKKLKDKRVRVKVCSLSLTSNRQLHPHRRTCSLCKR